jgi:hypothetical protein
VQQAAAAGFPTGPFAFLKSSELKIEVNRLMAQRACSANGMCTVRIGKTRPPAPGNVGNGSTTELVCTETKKDGTGCKFMLVYEFSTEGFQFYRGNTEHTNHTLAEDVPAAMARHGGKQIPPEYDDLGTLLAESGLSAKQIFRYAYL